MDRLAEKWIRDRAENRCEYCRLPQSAFRLPFVFDHIIARQHGGQTDPSNLAVCCGRCNLHKGPNIASVDPISGQISRLFNPRIDQWAEHFQWNRLKIEGLSPVGRATIVALALNNPDQIARRQALISTGEFPLT